MTLILDKMVDSVTVREGGCYWMPARRLMSGMNTGKVTALMWDLYTVPGNNSAQASAQGETESSSAAVTGSTRNDEVLAPLEEEDDVCRVDGGVLVDGDAVRPLSPKE